MKARIITLLFLVSIPFIFAYGKSNKTNKALITLTSYDKNGKEIRSGCGFYISNDGYALSTYDIFKNAASVDVIDSKGKKCKVSRICGANSLYNIVKFRTENSSTESLPVASGKLDKGSNVTIISNNDLPPVATVVTEMSDIDEFKYYTLEQKTINKYSGSPVMNSNGEVAAILQTSQSRDNANSYALDIAFASLLSINGMSATEIALNNIYIPKELPVDEPQARTYIYMFAQNSRDTTSYLTALNDYVSAFPQETIGYTQLATYWVASGEYAKAEEIMEKGIAIASEKADIHYEKSKLIYRLNMLKDYKQYKDWDINKALSEVSEAISINPISLYTLQKADCEFALKQYEAAYNSYQEVNASNISSPEIFNAASVAAEMAKKDSTIILALLDSAVARFGTPPAKGAAMYLLQRAAHLNKYGRYKEAARDYQAVEDLRGTKNLNDNFFYQKSVCDTRARLYAWALADIEKALSIRPNDYDYTVEKALAHWRMGNYDEAIYAGQQALKLNPQGADAYKAIGLAYGEQGKKADAIKNLTKAKELGDPQAEELIQNLK